MASSSSRDRWWLVAASALAVFMAQLDATVVTVALPTIERQFGTRTSLTEWVVLGYLLPLVALTLPSGRWLDQVGRRAALAVTVGGFGCASVLAGVAPGIGWLILARGAQGMFGAALFALVPAITATAVGRQAQGRAMAVIMAVGPLGAVAGPAVGGFLIDTVGWPWIFYLNVPVSVAVIAIGLAQLPADGRLRLPDRAWVSEAALIGAAVAAVLLGLSFGASHGLWWLALTLAGLPPVLGWLRRPDSATVVRLLRTRSLAGPHLALLAEITAFMIVQFIAVFYLSRVLHAPAATTGLTLLALPAATALVGPVGGALADRWNAWWTAAGGAVLVTIGALLVAPLSDDWSAVDLAWRLAVVGAGAGLFAGPNQAIAMSRSPRESIGTTGATTSLARQLGIALAPAVATTVWAASGYTAGGMRLAVGMGVVLGAASIVALVRSRSTESAPPSVAQSRAHARTRQ